MQKLFIILLSAMISLNVFSQAPQKMSYQAVIRNSSNVLITNTAIGMRVSILQGSTSGSVVFQETFNPNPQTNANGLVTVEIGTGTPVIGTFGSINWATGPYFVMTETDPSGGMAYSIMGVQQLLSVPYALYSATSGNSPLAPTVSTQMATNILSNSATLNGNVNANGFRTTVSFDYGLTTAYGNTVTSPSLISGNANTASTVNIAGLSPNTVYHFRAKATNAVDVSYGSDLTFSIAATTPSAPLAQSVLNPIDTVDASTIRFKGGVYPNNDITTVTFEYGTTTSYGTTVAATPSPISGTGGYAVISSNITGLVIGTTYHFRVKAVNSIGTSYSPDQTFYRY